MTYENEGFIGSGLLFLDVYDDTGARTGELFVGNASTFAVSAPTLEKKEQKSMMTGSYAQTIKTAITKVEQEIKFTLTDINRNNLRLAMFGEASDLTQAAGDNTGTPESVTVIHDRWVKLTYRNLDPENAPSVAEGATVYTEGTDYEIDYKIGMIRTLPDGAITDGSSVDIEYNWLAVSGFKITGHTTTRIESYIRLSGQDEANERDYELIAYKVQLEPSGDINWLTEEFAQLDFTGKMLATTDGMYDVLFY